MENNTESFYKYFISLNFVKELSSKITKIYSDIDI